jgi:hypothetical protein
MKQEELFQDIDLDKRQEFIIFQRFAVKRLLGWQDFIASQLVKQGNYTFNITGLIPEFMLESDLTRLGYTVITPSKENYRDTLPIHITIRFSKPEFAKIKLNIQF